MLSLRSLASEPLFRTRGLRIRGIGVREVMPPAFIQRPQGTGDYLFMLFHDSVEIGPPSDRTLCPPSTMMLWARGDAHYYGTSFRRWSHSWIHCDGVSVRKILERAAVRSTRRVYVHDPSVIDRCLVSLHGEVMGHHPPDPVVVLNTLEILVRESVRSEGRPALAPVPAAIARVKHYIDTNYERRTSLRQLGQLAELSAGHLCTEFARHYGVSPITYAIHCRLHAAATLIRGTTMPLGAIGRHVGYADPYFFSKQFKAYFGVPASDLRK